MPSEVAPQAGAEAVGAISRAAAWLADRVAPDGRPADADERNGWSRLGWGLVCAGRPGLAAAVVEWAGRERIGPDGAFLPGPSLGQSYVASFPNYWLGTFVVSAWMAGRPEIAMRSMGHLRRQVDERGGGVPMAFEDGGGPVYDMLSTAQTGLAAIVVGDHAVAHACAKWVIELAAQDGTEGLVFRACRRGGSAWLDPPPTHAWGAIVDFALPRQAYYVTGMGAVLLARHAARYDDAACLAAARRLVAYNVSGSTEQFDDLSSVQACKFGWAVAELGLADREVDWTPWVERMAAWFLDRQSPDGGWGPSRFADPDPAVADRLVKTSEHLMELAACEAALATSRSRRSAALRPGVAEPSDRT